MDQATVRSLFTYDSESGNLIWNSENPYHRRFNGRIAGSIEPNSGYFRINIYGKSHQAHRLIWLYHHGYLPVELDHEDQNKLNNRLENLREVTTVENRRNYPLRKDNKYGCPGIHLRRGSYEVSIQGKYVASFKTLEEAIAKRRSLEEERGFHKNHGVK
jgi:hypothetical protein